MHMAKGLWPSLWGKFSFDAYRQTWEYFLSQHKNIYNFSVVLKKIENY